MSFQERRMTTLVDDLSAQAMSLSVEDRVCLAERLLATVHVEDPAVTDAWDREIQWRLAEVDAGTAELVSAADVFLQVRKALA
jgi:Putative addiction module component